MWPFSKSDSVSVEQLPIDTPQHRYLLAQSNLLMALQDLNEANRARRNYNESHSPDLRVAIFNNCPAFALNAMTMAKEMERRKLESNCRQKEKIFTEANRELSEAKKAAGLATY